MHVAQPASGAGRGMPAPQTVLYLVSRKECHADWRCRNPCDTIVGNVPALLHSACAQRHGSRDLLCYRPSGCWRGSWRAAFPTSCDSQGITDQESCTAFCDPDGGGKKNGMWIGDPGPGACTCTGCLFCQTCANPKPQDDGEPPLWPVCVCSASTETTSLASRAEGLDGLLPGGAISLVDTIAPYCMHERTPEPSPAMLDRIDRVPKENSAWTRPACFPRPFV
jgi:hypothetical protein